MSDFESDEDDDLSHGSHSSDPLYNPKASPKDIPDQEPRQRRRTSKAKRPAESDDDEQGEELKNRRIRLLSLIKREKST